MPSPDDLSRNSELVESVIKTNPDLSEAKRLARENFTEVKRALRALGESRDLSEKDLRIQFNQRKG
jgi:hypothetical protein